MRGTSQEADPSSTEAPELESPVEARVPMAEDDVERYRMQAEQCREQAARAVSPLDRDAWLRAAEDWLCLAHAIEEQGAKRP